MKNYDWLVEHCERTLHRPATSPDTYAEHAAVIELVKDNYRMDACIDGIAREISAYKNHTNDKTSDDVLRDIADMLRYSVEYSH